MAAQPDATLGELRGWLLAERGVAVSPLTIWRALAGLGLTRIKSRSRPPSRRARASPLPGLDPERLVFVDEAWDSTNMARRIRHGPRGACVLATVPHGHGKTSTFVAELRPDGIVEPLVLDGAIMLCRGAP